MQGRAKHGRTMQSKQGRAKHGKQGDTVQGKQGRATQGRTMQGRTSYASVTVCSSSHTLQNAAGEVEGHLTLAPRTKQT